MAETQLVINGQKYPIPDSFTLGELADMEKITGQGYDHEQGGALGLLALAYVAMRRERKNVTVDDIRSLGPDDITTEGGDASPPSPTGNEDSKQTSSPGSANDSEQAPDVTLEATGTPV